LLIQTANWLGKVLRSKVVLEHPEDPEDTRVLNLFHNRAELKKQLGDARDEVHRLKDRMKLQEAATARVREQLEQLEGRLAAPLAGLHCLAHYQLRDLWATGHAQIAALIRELSQQREDSERRQFVADLNRHVFERSQSARADCAQAEHVLADARAHQGALQTQLARSGSWWQYFTRRDLSRRLLAMQAEVGAANELLQQARRRLAEIEEQVGARFPGLSVPARRMLNLMAIACAQLLALRLRPPGLLPRVIDAMTRSVPNSDELGDAPAALALMQEIGRAKAAMLQDQPAIRAEVRRLADQLAAAVKYAGEGEVLPEAYTVQLALRGAMPRGEQMAWDLLREDLWSLSDLFYAAGDY
jgi:hypothetical protein